MFRLSYPRTVALCCEHCQAIHENVPIQCDEDGPYAEPETEICHADGCGVRLCSSCRRFICDGCGLVHCVEHRVVVAGLDLCTCCMGAEIEEGARALMEAL